MTNIGINTTDDFDFSYYKANSFGITAKAAMNLNTSSFVGAGIQSIYSETISTDTKKKINGAKTFCHTYLLGI